MAAYAALVSVMHLIHDIQHHPSPPISIHTQQLQSLSHILTSLQEFLEAYKSPVADADEADPLEMRIADVAYAAENVIESRIVDKIHLTTTLRKPENVDDEQTKSIKFYQDLQRVIEEMDLIKQEAMQIDTEKAVAVSSSVAPFRSFSSSSAMVCSEFLDEVSSWDLFCRTVFGERDSCPHELEEIGKKIVESCRGLPLSIVVVGGILKRMEPTQRCWEPIRNNLTTIVNLENDKHCLRLLKLSYNHLPVYLKPCFLYMGVFEEDDRISVSTLISLWVSEGFLKPMNDRSMETIAMDFLKDLIDRNLILIDRLGSTGNIRSCRIHDLLRELCLNEGQSEGFHHVIGRYSQQGINRQCRRIVIPRNSSENKVLEELKSMPHARSLICEYEKVPRCWNFGLLRTLHAYKYSSSKENSLSTQYVNLRHLAIEVGSMSSLLSSFHLFWNLYTLVFSCPSDYKCTTVLAEIWKMPQFRHIEFIAGNWCLPDPPSNEDDDVVTIENLRILKGVKNLKFCEEVIKRIPNIKKLKLFYEGQLQGTKHDDPYCVSNIKSLCKLESLFVYCRDSKYGDAPDLHKLSFPHSLKSLTLYMRNNGGFEWEAVLEKIGSLPHLEKLKLRYGWFRTGEWEIVQGQFPELRILELGVCGGLKQWTVEEGSSVLPHLEQLLIVRLTELEEIPCEIGHIPTLQKVELRWCSESAVKSAKEMVEEQVELQGDQLPFHVTVTLLRNNQALLGLKDHNFTVY